MEITTPSKAGETEERTVNGCSSGTLPTKRTSKERWPEIRARAFFSTCETAPAHELSSHNLLSREEQRQLYAIATLIDFRRAGVTIYSQGEEARSVYFIDEGIIRISRCGENGQRQILELKVAGDLLGLPDGGRYANSAETVSAARVFRCPWQRVQQMMLTDPHLQLNLLTKVADQVRQAQRRIMMLGQQNVCQRLASFLLDFISLPEFFDERRSHLILPVNRLDLADYLGTAPESTARAFAKLESEGLVRRISSRTIEILDVEGLQHLQCGRRRAHRQASEPAPA
jgi:CRP/FNR family transcriptional regulator